jgi:membrane-associated protease RseP (regulator of RpoE activity)
MSRLTSKFAAMLIVALTDSALVAQDDDTKAVVALSEAGAQLQLDSGRIIVLMLAGDNATDETMKFVEGLKSLQTLRINGGKVTGAGLAHAEKLPALHTLWLENAPLADRDVERLSQLKSVSTYVLHGTDISGMGLQRLQSLLAKQEREVSIDYHRGGLFGVSGSPTYERCQISMVVPESAAASAEIQPGDIIVKFDGQPITDFPSLQAVVSQTPPGEPIAVKIEREGKTIDKRVTLARRPAAFP